MDVTYTSVSFSGTLEEFEAFRTVLPESTGRDVAAEVAEGNADAEAFELSPADALKVLEYRGGLSKQQQRLMAFLFEHEEEVFSDEIREALGLERTQFRGIVGNFPRRVRGALGRDDGVRLIGRKWDQQRHQMRYWLSAEVREAYARYRQGRGHV